MFKYNLARLDKLYEDADIAIKEDRDMLKPIFDLIDKYIMDNKLLRSSIEQLIDIYGGKTPSMNIRTPSYELYSLNALVDSNNLANKISEINKFTVLHTVVPYKKFQVAIMGTKLITIHKIEVYKDISLVEVMKPFYGYIAPELEMIMLYKKLYSPHYSSEWDECLKYEDSLHKICKSRINVITGVIDRDLTKEGGATKTFVEIKEIVFTYITGSKYKQILVGEVAYDIGYTDISKITILDLFKQGEKKLQFIGDINVDELLKNLNNLNISGVDFVYKKQQLHLPFDERQQKYTFYANINNKQYIIFELFNNMEYELIPYKIVDKMYIGTIQLLLYVLYIDIWIIQLIGLIGQLQSTSRFNKISALYVLMDKYRAILNDPKYIALFKNYNYFMGIYQDEKLYLKQLIVSSNIQQYIPVLYKKYNNKYRQLQ